MSQRSRVLTLLCAAVSFVPCFGQTQATFQTQTQNLNSYQFPSSAPSVYPVDLNNDGIQDLVQVPSTANPANGFQVYLAKGDGTFTPGYSYTFSNNPGSNIIPVIGDFNGDGNADIVFILSGTNLIATFLGNGDGTFQTPIFQNVVGSSTPFGAAATVSADYNHDGKLDIVATTETNESTSTLTTIVVLPGNGDGTFGFPEIQYQEPNGSPSNWLGVGDFDNDGNMDVAYLLFTNCGLGSSDCQASLHVLYGSGTATGGFTDTTPYTSSQPIMSFAAGDLNSDGTTDLFGIVGDTPQQLVTLYGASDRTMPVYTQNVDSNYFLSENGQGPGMALGDFNGDAQMDLVVQGADSSGSQVFALFLSTGSPGAFTEQIVDLPLPSYTASSSQSPLVGAFASDYFARPDIITLSETNNANTEMGYATILEALNQTNGGFWGGCAFPSSGLGISLCSPGTLVANNPLTFDASANSFGEIRKIELWVDGVKLNEQFHAWEQRAWFDDGNVTIAPGNHSATLFATDIDNRLQSLTFNLTVVNCTAPSSPGVNVCSPANGTTVSSPVQATAAATVTGTILRMEVWVDGVKEYSTFGANALSTSIPLASGSHQFGYYAVNTAGQKWLTLSNVTVQ
jgi:FG-GAP-like repeat/Bacterial Ig domain